MMLQNIDTLEVSYDITNYSRAISGYLDDLEYAKNSASQNEDGREYINIFGSHWYILGSGARFYSYILHNDDLEIRIAKCRSKSLDNYPVQVRYKSRYLWSVGFKQAVCEVENLLYTTFGEVLAEKVSRVDLCCHTDDFVWSENDINRFLGKYKKDNIYRHNRSVNGFVFGTGTTGVMCRIYDKILEIKQSSDKQWFYDIWEQNNMFPFNIWNIEFQLTRDFLREIKINSIKDLFNNLGSLWTYCTENWIVLKDLTNTRLERCPINALWSKIQTVFALFAGEGFIKRKKQIISQAETYVPAIVGYVTSFLSCLTDSLDLNTAFDVISLKCRDYLEEKSRTFENEIKRKRSVRLGLGVV